MKAGQIRPFVGCWMFILLSLTNAEFVCHMEDILDLYHRPYDPRYLQVCFDEARKQLISETSLVRLRQGR